MNGKYCILLLFFSLPLMLKAQKKGDNTIILKGVNADQVITILLDSGYRLETMTNEFTNVRTDYRSYPQYGLEISLILNSRGDQANIQGKWKRGAIAGDIVWINKKQVAQNKAFRIMQGIAASVKKPLIFAKL